MAAKILFIDDDVAFIDVFKTALEAQGFKVSLAENGMQGLKLAGEELPNLVLLDLMMPDINGTEVLKRLKQDARTRDIPVVVLTNFGQEQAVKEALFAGASDFLLKYQIGAEDLLNKVNTVLKAQKKEVS